MKPYYDDGTVQIYHGDSRELLPELRADVIVTDPPYGLEFMGKEWDKFDRRGPASFENLGPLLTPVWKNRPRWSTMGPKAMVAYQAWCTEWAAAALDALPAGGWLLAFGGTRTWHRLVSGVEDAGFEVRDTLAWLYGSGAPRPRSCLKPGWEPILLARKPGVNVLQIDACRVGPPTDTRRPNGKSKRSAPTHDEDWQPSPSVGGQVGAGRWPTNVALDSEAADLLDQQSDGTSRFFYTAKAGRTERITVDGESHPTVKPLALMRWLVRLVTPPGGTVLDPFCGSGSTLVAARMEGFRAIGVEADERWCKGSAIRLREHEQGQGVLDLSG